MSRKKPRAKEKGLVSIRNSDLIRLDPVSVKPRFNFFRCWEPGADKNWAWPYPITGGDPYAQYAIQYLGSLYKELEKQLRMQDIKGKALSFKVNGEAIQQYVDLSADLDIHAEMLKIPPMQDDRFTFDMILNQVEGIAEFRKDWLADAINSKHDVVGGASTHRNTYEDIDQDRAILDLTRYRPVCNNIVNLGNSFGVKRFGNGRDPMYEMFWETCAPDEPFLDYLKEVHKIITGVDYDSQNLKAGLEISTVGRMLSDSDRSKMEQRIAELTMPGGRYQDLSEQSRFMHSTVQERKGDLYARHMDGAIFNYDFNTLRKALFSWRDKEGKVDQNKGQYSKVFKIDVAGSAPNDGYVLPIYSSLENPEKFDMHDLVDVFMARYML